MTTTAELLTSHEIAERAGITYRQLDYWCRAGLLDPTVAAAGSGTRRGWHADMIPILDVLGTISAAFDTGGRLGAPVDVLRRVVDHYEAGRLELGNGVAITWPT